MTVMVFIFTVCSIFSTFDKLESFHTSVPVAPSKVILLKVYLYDLNFISEMYYTVFKCWELLYGRIPL